MRIHLKLQPTNPTERAATERLIEQLECQIQSCLHANGQHQAANSFRLTRYAEGAHSIRHVEALFRLNHEYPADDVPEHQTGAQWAEMQAVDPSPQPEHNRTGRTGAPQPEHNRTGRTGAPQPEHNRTGAPVIHTHRYVVALQGDDYDQGNTYEAPTPLRALQMSGWNPSMSPGDRIIIERLPDLPKFYVETNHGGGNVKATVVHANDHLDALEKSDLHIGLLGASVLIRQIAPGASVTVEPDTLDPHANDCAVPNGPTMDPGPCNCNTVGDQGGNKLRVHVFVERNDNTGYGRSVYATSALDALVKVGALRIQPGEEITIRCPRTPSQNAVHNCGAEARPDRGHMDRGWSPD
jgi:hypothetical protein